MESPNHSNSSHSDQHLQDNNHDHDSSPLLDPHHKYFRPTDFNELGIDRGDSKTYIYHFGNDAEDTSNWKTCTITPNKVHAAIYPHETQRPIYPDFLRLQFQGTCVPMEIFAKRVGTMPGYPIIILSSTNNSNLECLQALIYQWLTRPEDDKSTMQKVDRLPHNREALLGILRQKFIAFIETDIPPLASESMSTIAQLKQQLEQQEQTEESSALIKSIMDIKYQCIIATYKYLLIGTNTDALASFYDFFQMVEALSTENVTSEVMMTALWYTFELFTPHLGKTVASAWRTWEKNRMLDLYGRKIYHFKYRSCYQQVVEGRRREPPNPQRLHPGEGLDTLGGGSEKSEEVSSETFSHVSENYVFRMIAERNARITRQLKTTLVRGPDGYSGIHAQCYIDEDLRAQLLNKRSERYCGEYSGRPEERHPEGIPVLHAEPVPEQYSQNYNRERSLGMDRGQSERPPDTSFDAGSHRLPGRSGWEDFGPFGHPGSCRQDNAERYDTYLERSLGRASQDGADEGARLLKRTWDNRDYVDEDLDTYESSSLGDSDNDEGDECFDDAPGMQSRDWQMPVSAAELQSSERTKQERKRLRNRARRRRHRSLMHKRMERNVYLGLPEDAPTAGDARKFTSQQIEKWIKTAEEIIKENNLLVPKKRFMKKSEEVSKAKLFRALQINLRGEPNKAALIHLYKVLRRELSSAPFSSNRRREKEERMVEDYRLALVGSSMVGGVYRENHND